MRYVVTEIEGYRITPGRGTSHSKSSPGTAFAIIDTLWNHRIVAQFETERGAHIRANQRPVAEVRAEAATRCDLLNRLDEIARAVA